MATATWRSLVPDLFVRKRRRINLLNVATKGTSSARERRATKFKLCDARQFAADFLQGLLAEKSMPVTEIERSARDAGLLGRDQPISQCKPFRAARNRLGIKPSKCGVGWFWSLGLSGD
jgi:hypothetical protein